jgi:hypothetical protein
VAFDLIVCSNRHVDRFTSFLISQGLFDPHSLRISMTSMCICFFYYRNTQTRFGLLGLILRCISSPSWSGGGCSATILRPPSQVDDNRWTFQAPPTRHTLPRQKYIRKRKGRSGMLRRSAWMPKRLVTGNLELTDRPRDRPDSRTGRRVSRRVSGIMKSVPVTLSTSLIVMTPADARW